MIQASLKARIFYEQKCVKWAYQAVRGGFFSRIVLDRTMRLKNVTCTAGKANFTHLSTVFAEKYSRF